MADLHQNDMVTYDVGHTDGWISVWIENLQGEKMTKVSTGGMTELVIPEQGYYIFRVEGDHAGGSIVLSIYTVE